MPVGTRVQIGIDVQQDSGKGAGGLVFDRGEQRLADSRQRVDETASGQRHPLRSFGATTVVRHCCKDLCTVHRGEDRLRRVLCSRASGYRCG